MRKIRYIFRTLIGFILLIGAVGCVQLQPVPQGSQSVSPPYHSTPFVPKEFLVGISEAKAVGCDIVFLKPGVTNAVQKWYENKSLHLAIYDADDSGRLRLANHFKIPSWYEKATVDYHPLLVDHQYFMGIKFEGNTGTGYMQYLYMLVVWQEERYDIVLLETVGYDVCSSAQAQLSTKIDFNFLSIGTLGLATSYTLDVNAAHLTSDNEMDSAEVQARWSDVLGYREKTACFYDQAYEEYWSGISDLPVRRRVALARLLFLRDRPKLDSIKEYLETNSSVFYGILD
ncbi:MAG: hypothetical protein U1F87_19190 [Kiritimatiellia bacterium]